jgi:hypothetical protein
VTRKPSDTQSLIRPKSLTVTRNSSYSESREADDQDGPPETIRALSVAYDAMHGKRDEPKNTDRDKVDY